MIFGNKFALNPCHGNVSASRRALAELGEVGVALGLEGVVAFGALFGIGEEVR